MLLPVPNLLLPALQTAKHLFHSFLLLVVVSVIFLLFFSLNFQFLLLIIITEGHEC